MFIAALFIIIKAQREIKCPEEMGEYKTVKCYLAMIKKYEFLQFTLRNIESEIGFLNEILIQISRKKKRNR